MGSKFPEPRKRELPILTVPSATFLTILSTLVALLAAPRVLPLRSPGPLFFAVSTFVVFVAVALCTRKSRSNIDLGTVMFGACTAVALGFSELTRLLSEANAGGFAVQLRSLGAEDASAWTRIAGALYWQDAFLSWQGYPVAILLSLVSGALRPFPFLHGQQFGTIGYSTLVVSGAFSALVLWIAVVCALAYRRLAGVERMVRILIPVVVGLTLFQFVDEARRMGHLTAALAAMTLVTVLLAFSGADTHGRKFAGTLPLAVAFLGASLVWLPLAVVGFYAVLFAAWSALRGRGSPVMRGVLIVGAGLVGWTLFSGLPARAENLFTATGGTQSASSVVLVVTMLLLLGLAAAGSDFDSLVGPILLVIAVLTILLGDSYYNTSPGYGAVKTLWVVTPVLFSSVLIEFARSRAVAESRRFQSVLALGMIFTAFAAGVPQSVTQAITSAPAAEGTEIAADGISRHWDTGYLEASRALEDLPVACVIWDETQGRFVPGWQGYLCTRYLGWSAAPSGCRGDQICRQSLDPAAYSGGLRFFGISRLSLTEVVTGLAAVDFDPQRTVLVIDGDGRVLDEVSLSAFIERVVNP